MYSQFLIFSLSGLFFCIIWYFFFREKIGSKIPNVLMSRYSKTPFLLTFLWITRGIIFFLLFTIIFDPQINKIISVPTWNERNTEILLDVSRSMQTDDIEPNRLEKAKELIGKFFEKKELGNIGYIAFAGKPFVLSPLTNDISWLSDMIKNTTSSTINQWLKDTSGTNIGDAILEANLILSRAQGNNEKSIILITDGRANIGIDPLIAAKESKEKGIRIYSIAVGSDSWSLLSYKNPSGKREYFYDEAWNKLKVDIDELTLQKIAESTQWKYFRAQDADLFEKVFQDLGGIFTPTLTYKNIEKSVSLIPLFFGIIIFLTILHELLAFTLRKTYKVA